MTKGECLDYEIRSSWWVSRVTCKPLQKLASRYFAWKVNRKYNRWFDSRFEQAWNNLMKETI